MSLKYDLPSLFAVTRGTVLFTIKINNPLNKHYLEHVEFLRWTMLSMMSNVSGMFSEA